MTNHDPTRDPVATCPDWTLEQRRASLGALHDVLGTDRSTIELSTLQSERSRVLRLAGDGSTSLRQNILERRGEGNGLPAMIEIEGDAAPVLVDNQLLGTGTAALVGSDERAREFSLRNQLRGDALEVKVRSAAVSSTQEGEG